MTRLAIALVAMVAVLAAGCGSDDSSSDTTAATDWANGVCTALSTWTNSLKSTVSSLGVADLNKDGLESAVDDAKSATETMVSDLKALGRPDTESGQEAQDEINTLTDQLTSGVDSIESSVSGASGISGVLSAVSSVTATLKTMGTDVTNALSSLENLDAKGELQDAFSQAEACKSLTNS